jgi:GNAT superfamily N-acetyltransferase
MCRCTFSRRKSGVAAMSDRAHFGKGGAHPSAKPGKAPAKGSSAPGKPGGCGSGAGGFKPGNTCGHRDKRNATVEAARAAHSAAKNEVGRHLKAHRKATKAAAKAGTTAPSPRELHAALSKAARAHVALKAARETHRENQRVARNAARREAAERLRGAAQGGIKHGETMRPGSVEHLRANTGKAKPGDARIDGMSAGSAHTPGKSGPEAEVTRAAIRYGEPGTGTSREKVGESVRSVFGRDVDHSRVASAVGAPHDAVVTFVRTTPDLLAIHFTTPVLSATRIIKRDGDKVTINNRSFHVADESRGKGIGADVFGRQVHHAADLGVDHIHTLAEGTGGSNGAYTWPRFGYDAPLDRSYYHSSLPPALAGATRISDLMKTPEGRSWWKENGAGGEMKFDLKTGSLSRQAWDAYRAAKSAKPEGGDR